MIPTGGMAQVLVADDDGAFRLATRTLLEDEGYAVALASSAPEALQRLGAGGIDLLLSDVVMGSMSGIDLLREVRTLHPDLPVIMVTGFGSVQTAVDAMRLGATDFLTKPCNNTELLVKIGRALELRAKDRELRALREELRLRYSAGGIVTRSASLRDLLAQVKRVADTDVTVLLRGESGTGKELVARALHHEGVRAGKPFVTVNCSAIPDNLLESELFGYEKGAFTGAVRQRAGRFEEANTGTLFLDEVGELPPAIQAKLLRVLQEKTFERVGGNATLTADVRVVAATNRDLERMIAEGTFREDLYYRLNVFPLRLPPLRERLEDIPLLAEHFLERHADLSGGAPKRLAPAVIADMMNYPWRGNVRELENLIKRAILKTPGDVITTLELSQPDLPRTAQTADAVAIPDHRTPFKAYLDAIVRDAEQKYLVRMLIAYRGNVNQIARLMEVDRKTVYRKLGEHGIDPAAFRAPSE